MNSSHSRFESLESRQLLSAGGDLDPTFGAGGKVIAQNVGFPIVDLAVQNDGKIVAVGQVNGDFAVARLNANGTMDTTFGGGNGVTITDFGGNEGDFATTVAIQPNGKILVAGSRGNQGFLGLNDNGNFAIARYNADGTLDKSFDHDGKVFFGFHGVGGSVANALAIMSDGRLLVAGTADTIGFTDFGRNNKDFAVARLFSDGSLDHSFGEVVDLKTGSRSGKATFGFGGEDETEGANAIALAPDGKIVLGGVGGAHKSTWAIAQLNANGTLDKTFGTIAGHGKFHEAFPDGANLLDLSVQPNGDIIAVGGTRADFAIGRIKSDGQLDQTFGRDGLVQTDMGGNDEAKTVRVTREGILVAGGSSGKFALARYKTNGSLDTSFGAGGKVITAMAGGDAVLATSLTPDGKLLAFGRSGSVARYIFATPKVNIFSIDNTGSEQGPDDASFIVTRDAVYDFTTRVFFDLSGTATFGADYSSTLKLVSSTIGGGGVTRGLISRRRAFVDIPAGQSFVEVPIHVNDDKAKEAAETVNLSIFDSPLYAVGANRSSSVTIADNDNIILHAIRRVGAGLFSASRI
jgi:uncharacterized delta-60 repeat protein